ncbi:hypothetical protein GCM10010967_54390 [Dyadobacter beijingensis]|uniref:DUF4384 domain-containing protein n=1 Tax=Dyadobacter beijingensis TaxID=365489 RepID=A0ABQ2IHG8_9BACT|nr:hypothetical protein [Dyadobacter beijingensis]GGN11581.1 hypothetical protein GCM10010967_54390 [Dyadobacter beijingensis]
MKRLLGFLIVVFLSDQAFAQALSPYYQLRAADRVKQVLKDFESAFGLLTNPYITDRDERDEASYRLRASLRADARFENDLVPGNQGTQTIGFQEYQRIAFAGYQKSGLSYHADWEQAEFKSVTDGFLVFLYGTKSLFGNYQGRRRLQLENVPCRAGVFLKMKGNEVIEAKIGFMDTDMREKSSQLLSLTDHRNPLVYITLPEAIDQLSAQILHALSQKDIQKLFIEEITFRELGISNDFSKQVTGTLKTSLARLSDRLEIGAGNPQTSDPLARLTGGYEQAGNYLKMTVKLSDSNGKPLGGTLMGEILLGNIPNAEVEPAGNLVREALLMREVAALTIPFDNELMETREVLRLEVSTDKGFGPQLYREGDMMTLKVRANKPCTVRMIYQDAAKNIVRLRNNDFKITADAVGSWIDIPEKFECAAPFGFEMLLAFATEGTFRPIEKTESQNGITFILDDLKKVLEATAVNAGDKRIAKCMIPVTTQARRSGF